MICLTPKPSISFFVYCIQSKEKKELKEKRSWELNKNAPFHVITGVKVCLIAVQTIFSWNFSSLPSFLIDVVGSFLIATARAVNNHMEMDLSDKIGNYF